MVIGIIDFLKVIQIQCNQRNMAGIRKLLHAGLKVTAIGKSRERIVMRHIENAFLMLPQPALHLL